MHTLALSLMIVRAFLFERCFYVGTFAFSLPERVNVMKKCCNFAANCGCSVRVAGLNA